MHRIIRERLEDLLPGTLESAELQDVAQHLRVCEQCRREVSEMRHCSELVQVLRAPADLEPRPGFYSRLMDGIASQLRPSPWSIFLEPQFGKRLVYAALTALILMGTYLITNEWSQTTIASSEPEVIMATQPGDQTTDQQAAESDQQRASDRDRILVQLATYSQ